MNNSKSQRSIIFGACILAVGLLGLLDSLHIFNSFNILEFWPTIFIVFGGFKIYNARTGSGYVIGGVLVAAGVWITLAHLGLIHFRIHVWPLFLIGAGVVLILNRGKGNNRQRDAGVVVGDTSDDGQVDLVGIMSGNTVKMDNADFRGGEITVVMGGVDLDLRNATIVHEAVIHVSVLWGGIVLRVPRGWKVVTQGVPIMAGIEDKTEQATDNDKKLIIKGMVLMGGLEIKN